MAAEKDARPRRGILTRTTRADRGIVKLPALAPHLRFHEIDEAQVLLVSESFNTLLHGKLHCDLLPLLDGRHPWDEIVAALEGAHAAPDVLAAIAAFAAKGYLVSADHGMDRCEAAYWSSLGASPRWVEERLAQSRVTVEGDDGGLVRHLEANGARVGTGEPVLAVVVCGDYLEAHLAEVNRRRLEAGSAVGAGAAKRRGAALRPHFSGGQGRDPAGIASRTACAVTGKSTVSCATSPARKPPSGRSRLSPRCWKRCTG